MSRAVSSYAALAAATIIPFAVLVTVGWFWVAVIWFALGIAATITINVV